MANQLPMMMPCHLAIACSFSADVRKLLAVVQGKSGETYAGTCNTTEQGRAFLKRCVSVVRATFLWGLSNSAIAACQKATTADLACMCYV